MIVIQNDPTADFCMFFDAFQTMRYAREYR